MREKGLIDVYILEILEKHAGGNRKLTQKQILHYLEEEYRLPVTRKTLSGYLSELRNEGYIQGQRGLCKTAIFDDHELRLLIDGVLFGQHIPQEDANRLIEKLRNISYDSMKNRVRHICYLEEINRTHNENLYEMIDLIDEAIGRNRKIEITPCTYGVDGKLYDKEKVVVDPYYLVTEKNHYYLVCYAGRNEDLENRRVDRISHIKILREVRKPITELKKYTKGFDLAVYMREHIYMFSGDSCPVLLKIKKQNISDFIDWYGTKYSVAEQDEEFITIRIRVNENAVYYWALQYGSVAEILKPETLRRRLRDGLQEMLERYDRQ